MQHAARSSGRHGRRRYGSPNHLNGDVKLVNYVFIGDFVDRLSSPDGRTRLRPIARRRLAARIRSSPAIAV